MMKTWLEENYSINNSPYTDFSNIFCRQAIEKVCKKILEEVDHQVEVSSETTEGFVIGKNQLRDIIIDLGVKI